MRIKSIFGILIAFLSFNSFANQVEIFDKSIKLPKSCVLKAYLSINMSTHYWCHKQTSNNLKSVTFKNFDANELAGIKEQVELVTYKEKKYGNLTSYEYQLSFLKPVHLYFLCDKRLCIAVSDQNSELYEFLKRQVVS